MTKTIDLLGKQRLPYAYIEELTSILQGYSLPQEAIFAIVDAFNLGMIEGKREARRNQ